MQEIAEASRTGPATNIISGIAVGFETTALPASRSASRSSPPTTSASRSDVVPADDRIFRSAGIFGTAVATMGMLMTAAYILAMDTFGPITDNAGGIVEMSNQPEAVREITDALDSVGNTTKALTKGYAVGSAALAAFLLFSAYLDEVASASDGAVDADARARQPLQAEASSSAACSARCWSSSSPRWRSGGRQRRAGDHRGGPPPVPRGPGIMAGTSTPDYARCVDITVRGALREMVLPGLLASRADRRRRCILPLGGARPAC